MGRSGASDYGQLGAHPAARRASGEARAALTFAAIEGIIGAPLPPSARDPRRHRVWWRHNSAYGPAWHGWVREGWGVATVDLSAETVTFARAGG